MSEGSFSAWLREQCASEWDAVVAHPFAAAITTGDVPDAAMRRYLEQDFQFVDSFTALLGAAVAAADTFEARVPYGRFLGQVATTEEKTYFHRALEALGGSTEAATEPVTAEFARLMDDVRRSLDYPLIAAVLCVAEWCYLGWASRLSGPPPENWVHREWIELHEGEEFRAWVAFLRGELDRLGPALDAARRAEVLAVFRRAVELERRFFDMAGAGH
ncbi:TenA family protein [Nonomuraea pusilla]|uniref:Aminopyrimidine aminohydrolase n=1 Tax=Nonomuraea pusilla TaxID=46177 RepID=A0A1H7M3T4_9ACTN|nr:TenA family protein [Nonomuraea pusilla]SEL05648.1 thiaminase (transcriptional activator TenA) [Nonomuraea pusilla]